MLLGETENADGMLLVMSVWRGQVMLLVRQSSGNMQRARLLEGFLKAAKRSKEEEFDQHVEKSKHKLGSVHKYALNSRL